MNKQLYQNGWVSEMLISATQLLIDRYNEYEETCLVLFIARNYQLLIDYSDDDHLNQLWAKEVLYWRKCYRNKQTGRAISMNFDLSSQNYDGT